MTYADTFSDNERYRVFSLEPQYFLSDDFLKIPGQKNSFRGTTSAENSWCINALGNLVNDYSSVVTIDQSSVYARIFAESAPAQTITELNAMNDLNRVAIRLIGRWLTENSDYDTRNWQTLKNAIERDRLSSRKRFAD